MSNAQHWIARKGQPLQGSLTIPGDKSVSHRSVMFAALADGTSHIEGFLEGEDTRATARIFSQLGVRIETPSPSQRIVHGVGIDGLKAPQAPLDCGNAGTGMRLLAGLLAGQAFDCTLIGDESLSGRPMRRVTGPLSQMGARIDTQDDGTPPLHVHGGQALHGIDFASPVASAQVKSAVLLAGLYAQGETSVTEPHPTRDYTERMLSAFGVDIAFSPGKARLRGGQRLRATDIVVPADFSSAAFYLVAASIIPGSELRLKQVGLNPRRTGLLHALRLMGADISEENPAEQGGEPVADLVVRYAPLKGARIPEELVPDMIDEFPALFVAAIPSMHALDVMQLSSPRNAVLAALIFNALVIPALIPLALRGVRFRPATATALLRRNMLVYGLGGVLLPFAAIKAIDLLLAMVFGA